MGCLEAAGVIVSSQAEEVSCRVPVKLCWYKGDVAVVRLALLLWPPFFLFMEKFLFLELQKKLVLLFLLGQTLL